ncbi:MAG: zinc ribbon domain-containing protein [Solobacterium sp.]|nr:zinc ribbon domain-containing protein [Solobacterium sp.]
MNCPFCGAELREGSRFCTNCGQAVPAVTPSAEQGPVRPDILPELNPQNTVQRDAYAAPPVLDIPSQKLTAGCRFWLWSILIIELLIFVPGFLIILFSDLPAYVKVIAAVTGTMVLAVSIAGPVLFLNRKTAGFIVMEAAYALSAMGDITAMFNGRVSFARGLFALLMTFTFALITYICYRNNKHLLN